MAAKLSIKSVVTAKPAMRLPLIGLGTLQANDDAVQNAIIAAVEAGYRHIDTAYNYYNEKAIGKALKTLFDSGKIKREELFITSKLPRTAMRPNLVEEYINRCLTDLQLQYVDLYLIHHPVGFEPCEEATPKDAEGYVRLDLTTDHVALWKAMEAQVDAGRAKAIGVSNFTPAQVDRILKNARIPPAVNQVEFHLYFQQKEMQVWSKKTGVNLTAYSPLGSPSLVGSFISNGTIDSSKGVGPLSDPVVGRIAKTHKKTPAQVLLRHIIQLGVVAIPKSSKPERVKENLQVFDFELSNAEMSELNALDKEEHGRIFHLPTLIKGYDRHPENPYPKL
uniref:NADP-dependent oxidoreductase domain-containing protein n=1 Tax=Graphocephala atropunctata TaxID=36148 RepID=A0A1B6KCP1_9HEMI